ncbi:MAG: aldo/keto reductase [Planctomycetota bacterium]
MRDSKTSCPPQRITCRETDTEHLRRSRRNFLKRAASLSAAGLFAPGTLMSAGIPAARTAADQVPLGETGLKISRLGFGTGSHSGRVQKALGQRVFNDLIRYGYDHGLTFIDCSEGYETFEWIGEAIKKLPREELFLQSKIGGRPEDVLKVIDHHRRVYNTDYVDSMLIHCMVKEDWTDQWKRIMDGFDEAKDRKWIRAKGVSCHSLPALRDAAASDWPEVHLVRVNPQGEHIDGPARTWNEPGDQIKPVMEQIRTMNAKGRGVIGMKIIGNGDFVDAKDRKKSVRFAMAHDEINSVVIGFKNRQEIDEAIGRINRALAVG